MFEFVKKIQEQHPQEPKADPAKSAAGDPAKKLASLTVEAAAAARALSRAQLRGADTVKDEVATYEKAIPGAPWWLTLAEIAVNVATAGLGGALASKFGGAVAKHLAGSATKDAIGKIGEDGIVKTISSLRPHLVTGVSESIQQGFVEGGTRTAKLGLEAAAKRLEPGEPESSSTKSKDDENYSSNATIDFFTTHVAKLDAAGERYAKTISRQESTLQPILHTAPELAHAIMESIIDMCEEEKAVYKEAQLLQAHSTTAQFISGVAQGVAGRNQAGKMTVTDFSKGYGISEDKRYARGLLRLAVHIKDDGSLQVTSAALDGVAQELTDRITKRPLEKVPIPVRIVATSRTNREVKADVIAGPSMVPSAYQAPEDSRVWITRDEAGGVTVKGRLPRRGDESYFHDNQESAEALCRDVLSKSLEAWGIKHVNHDDASGRG